VSWLRLARGLAGDQVHHLVAGVDRVVGVALVPPAEHGAVDGLLHPYRHAVPSTNPNSCAAARPPGRRPAPGRPPPRRPRCEESRRSCRPSPPPSRHVPDHRDQLLGHRHLGHPAQRRLRHVAGQVAHPLQVGGHVDGGHHQPQVGGDRRLPGQQVVDLVLDLAVVRVDLGVAVQDLFGLVWSASAARWWPGPSGRVPPPPCPPVSDSRWPGRPYSSRMSLPVGQDWYGRDAKCAGRPVGDFGERQQAER